jgi:hypothetical protein
VTGLRRCSIFWAGFAGAERIQQAQKLSDVLELVNVAATEEEVKYLFVNVEKR